MRTARATRRHEDPSSGFILIGVVMFILALTILGLSLFSLSSFEAQFLGRSGRSSQTLYDAMSGIEWAKVILAKERRLQAVQDGEPAALSRPAGVVHVEASQGGNTSGAINYSSGNPVLIRATADDGRGMKRMVEAQFDPLLPNDLYRHLIECFDVFNVVDHISGTGPGTGPRITELWGPVRVNNNIDQTWETAPGVHPYAGADVPVPATGAFINGHWPGAWDVVFSTVPHAQFPFQQSIYTLDAGSGSAVRYFKSEAPPSQGYTIFDQYSAPTIQVRGTCIWLARKGMRFDRPVTVLGDPAQDRLIIVADSLLTLGTGVSIEFTTGIWFFSGLSTPTNVPVVLVSSAAVSFDRGDILTAPGAAGMITIFAQRVYMKGPPQSSGNKQVFRHDPAMDAVIDELIGKNVLPNSPAGAGGFVMKPGTWRELNPDNPS